MPLNKWLYAMYLLVTARKSISSVQLHAEIGVTQKTAWFMLQRLREACGNDPSELSGIIEIDECYVGEFAFRLNDGEMKRHTIDRLDNLFSATIGKCLTYKNLIA